LNSSTGGTVKRIFSKVILDFSARFTELNNGGDPIKIDSIVLRRLPKTSYVAEQTTPYSYTWNSAPTQFFDGRNAFETSDTVKDDHVGAHRAFYIPEYIVSDTGSYSYISVNVNLKDVTDASTAREYRIVIGDGIDQTKFPGRTNAYLLGNQKITSDVRISRNTQYKFTCWLVSYDQSSEQALKIYPQVMAWDSIATDPEDVYHYELKVSDSEFDLTNVTSASYTGQTTIKTDYGGGWDAVVTSGNAHCTLEGDVSGQPSGSLRFTYTGGAGTEARIEISTGPADRRITKYISVFKNNP
jgi:hypothetical protein